jgi:hypothetical protein
LLPLLLWLLAVKKKKPQLQHLHQLLRLHQLQHPPLKLLQLLPLTLLAPLLLLLVPPPWLWTLPKTLLLPLAMLPRKLLTQVRTQRRNNSSLVEKSRLRAAFFMVFLTWPGLT